MPLGGERARALVDAQHALTPGGKVISVDDAFSRPASADLLVLKELAESGALKPVIDRTYPLEEMVEALCRLYRTSALTWPQSSGLRA